MLKPFVYLQCLAADIRTRQEGQTMAEYSVVLAVITLAVVALFITLGNQIGTALDKVVDVLTGTPAGDGQAPPS